MDIYVLNQNFEKLGVIDDSESVIWTTRYFEPGEFEIKIPAGSNSIALLAKDNYLVRYDDDTVMIIERINIMTDVENGNFILASGRCLKSILDRRVIWKLQTYSGTAEEIMRSVLMNNIINPSLPARKISNFTLDTVQNFGGETIETQYTGNYISDVITDLCKTAGLGFKILLNNGIFKFVLFSGTDRSHKQTANLPVVFSPEYDNIITTDYTEEKTYYKNVALIAGEGEGIERKYNAIGTAAGLQRRELWVDANDVRSTTEDNGVQTTLTTEQYNALLKQRGEEKLSEVKTTQTFEGEVDTNVLYKYKEDFFLGDIVTAHNEYGIKSAPRITEIVESEDEHGYSVLPTFDGWEEEVEI